MSDNCSPAAVAGEPLAAVWRGGICEGVHSGHMRVTNPAGDVVLSRGSDIDFFPRSSLKPFQALAALRAGVDLTDAQLAIACASHAGSPVHVECVESILDSVGLDRSALQNTADFPLDPAAAAAVHARSGNKEPILQNCSGKHAAMLAACVAAGWDTASYLEPEHPLQALIAETLGEFTGTRLGWSVDGCGAPTATTSLSGLARAVSALALAPAGSPEHRIVTAMRAYPHLVSGDGRFDTLAMQHVPGLVIKGGAEGVLMGAFDNGATIITKVADGNHRANTPAFVAALAALGVRADLSWAREPVRGHGRPVGYVEWIEEDRE